MNTAIPYNANQEPTLPNHRLHMVAAAAAGILLNAAALYGIVQSETYGQRHLASLAQSSEGIRARALIRGHGPAALDSGGRKAQPRLKRL